MNKIQITHASADDFKPIKGLLKDCWLPLNDITPAYMETFLIAAHGKMITGITGLEFSHPDSLFHSLTMTERYCGHGLGIQLIDEIEKYAFSIGINTLYLFTTKEDRFFSRLGYQITDRLKTPAGIQATREFSHICPDSAVCMMKRI